MQLHCGAALISRDLCRHSHRIVLRRFRAIYLGNAHRRRALIVYLFSGNLPIRYCAGSRVRYLALIGGGSNARIFILNSPSVLTVRTCDIRAVHVALRIGDDTVLVTAEGESSSIGAVNAAVVDPVNVVPLYQICSIVSIEIFYGPAGRIALPENNALTGLNIKISRIPYLSAAVGILIIKGILAHIDGGVRIVVHLCIRQSGSAGACHRHDFCNDQGRRAGLCGRLGRYDLIFRGCLCLRRN